MTQKRRDRTEPKYKALDMTEHTLKVAIRTIDRHTREGYAKEHPDLISAFLETGALIEKDQHGFVRCALSGEMLAVNPEQIDALIEFLKGIRD